MTSSRDTVIARLLPFHSAAQLLDASVSTPVTFWPRPALSVGYGAALLAIAWTACLRRAAVHGPRSTRFTAQAP